MPVKFRPSILPDDRKTVWYSLAIFGILAALGYLLDNVPLMIVPVVLAIFFPGIPIAIHAILFLSVKFVLEGDKLTVVDWAGDPFVSVPRRQKIMLSQVAYIYHLKKEAAGLKKESDSETFFRNSLVKFKKYRSADSNPRLVRAVARSDNGLVLSDKTGQSKVYLMRFHDLARKERQKLAGRIVEANPDVRILMDEKEKEGLLGRRTECG